MRISNSIEVTYRDNVAVICVNRPEVRNAWDVPTFRAITGALVEANENDDVGAIVLTAAGTIYCAGVDMKAPKEPADASGRRPSVGSLAMARDNGWSQLLASSKPTVGAVNGAAIGLGATHLLSLDIRLAGDAASFVFPFLAVGILPELGSTALLPRLIGEGRARELLLTGRVVSAEEAYTYGLVAQVLPERELLEGAIHVAQKIAELPRHLVSATRRLLDDNGDGRDVSAALVREGREFVALLKAGGTTGPTMATRKGDDT
jgi:2-(1,2-epoxy-1,2-dihydrophenyl)acetyl-CoA isomerase